ncbi:MAG: hypothetical protein U9P44_02065 [archaeon]|nr:hypothetical protein [archaeon]
MGCNVKRWVDEKIDEGYSTEKIKKTLVKNGFSLNKALDLIKKVKIGDITEKSKDAKVQETKKRPRISYVVDIAIIFITIISIVAAVATIEQRCGFWTFGDADDYCTAIKIVDREGSVEACARISDVRLAGACIEIVFAKTGDKIPENVCSNTDGDLEKLCIAAIRRKNADISKSVISEQLCEDIEDRDIKLWCEAKNLKSMSLSESVAKCDEILDEDYGHLCRAYAYNLLGTEEKEDACRLIDDRLYRLVCRS